MALFQAFRAVRPAEGKAEKVAALPYDVVSREEAREIGEKKSVLFSPCRQSGNGSGSRNRSL